MRSSIKPTMLTVQPSLLRSLSLSVTPREETEEYKSSKLSSVVVDHQPASALPHKSKNGLSSETVPRKLMWQKSSSSKIALIFFCITFRPTKFYLLLFTVLLPSRPKARTMPKKTSVLSITPLKYSLPGPPAFSTISSAECTSLASLEGILPL